MDLVNFIISEKMVCIIKNCIEITDILIIIN